MTIGLSTTPFKLVPVAGATSVIIQNPASSGGAITITQRFPVADSDEVADPTTDPGFSLAEDASITLPFSQPIWITAGGAQDAQAIPFA